MPQKKIYPNWLFDLLLGITLVLSNLSPAYCENFPVSVRLRWHHQFQFAGYYAALEQGYYREAGLEVTIKEGSPTISPVEDVISGQSDFGVSNSNLVVEYLKGKPVLMLASVFQHSPIVLISPSTDERLADLADGRDVVLAVNNIELKAMFVNEGIPLERVHFVPYDRSLDELLKSPIAAFSAYISNEPYQLERRNIRYALFKPQSYGLDFYGDSLFTRQALWEQNPDLVNAFREATIKGWDYALAHPQEIIDLILRRYNTLEKSRDELEYEANKVRELIDSKLIEIGHINPGRWQHIADTYAKLGVVNSGTSLDGFLYARDQNQLPGWILPALIITSLAFLITFAFAIYPLRLKRLLGLAQKDVEHLAKRHSRMWEASQDGIWIVEASSGRVLDANPAAQRISGYSLAELLTMKVHDLDVDDTVADVESRIQTMINQSWLLFETRHKTKDGRVFNVEVNAIPDPEEGTLLIFVRDISERKQIEKSLYKAEQQMRSFLDTIQAGVVVADKESARLLYANQFFSRMFGYNQERLQAMTVYDLPPEQERDEIIRKFAASVQGEMAIKDDVPMRRSDGSVFLAEIRDTHIELDGRPCLLGLFSDNTERKRYELALKRESEKNQAILRNASDGIHLVGLDGRLIEASDSFFDMLGYSREEMLGMKVAQWDARHSEEELMTVLKQKILENPVRYQFETQHRCKDGRIIDVEVSTCSLYLGDENVLIAASRDITERKQTEQTQKFLLQCGLPSSGEDFFMSLARYLATTLGMEYVCIDRLEGDGLNAQTVAIYNDGSFEYNRGFTLRDTPYGTVLDESISIFTHEVCQLFPHNSALAELRAQSYIGTVLWDLQMKPIGLIAIIGQHPLKEPERAEALLKQIGPRVGWELERLQANRELKENEKRLRLALKSANQGLFDLNFQTGETLVSDEYASMLNYDPAEFHETHITWLERLHPEDKDAIEQSYLDYLEGRISDFRVEFRQRTRMGVWKWILSLGSIVEWDDQGKPLRMLGTHTDITERKIAETSLKNSERRFRRLFESSPDPTWIIVDGRFVMCNTAAVKQLGYTDQKILLDIHPEKLSPPFQANGESSKILADRMMAEAFTQGVVRFEWEHLRRDGSLFPVEVTLSRLEWHNQQALYCVWRDISERKRSEMALRQYQDRLELTVQARTEELRNAKEQLQDTVQALESVGTAIYWADANTGRLLNVNQFAATLLGYSREEICQLAVTDIDLNFSQEDYQNITNTIREKGYLRFDTTQSRKDGSLVPIEMTIYYQALTSPRIIGFGVDISERKNAEHALHEAKLAAEKATQAKSEFLANMSHEIRTPMNAILGLTQLMAEQVTELTQREQLAKIENAGKHLLSIINDILDFSKIEAGKMELEQIDFSLSSLLDEVYSLTVDQVRAKHLTLQVDNDGVPLWLRGDPTRLRQTILNYVGNAIKFTKQGSISLRVILLEEQGDNLYVRFEVCDTGIGLSADDMNNLFRSFQQVDSSTTRKHGGTGLGLVINKRLAELMGGTVGVESKLGQGSTFWLTAWLQRGTALSEVVVSSPTGKLQTLVSASSGVRILLAEDNELNQEVALGWLKKTGLEIDVACNGREVVEMAARTAYALILMDIQMPEMDGIEATRTIRLMPQYQTTPILAMTANVFDENRDAYLSAGMNDHIAKPVDPNILYTKLANYLPHELVVKEALSVDMNACKDVSAEQNRVLNIAVGLHYWQIQENYRKFLAKFANDYAGVASDVRCFINTGALTEAARLTHKLKGVVGTFGLMSLGTAVTELNQALNLPDAEKDGLQDSLEVFVDAMSEALKAIENYLDLDIAVNKQLVVNTINNN